MNKMANPEYRDVPEKYNVSFYEDCFKQDVEAVGKIDIDAIRAKYVHLLNEKKITEEKLNELIEVAASLDCCGNKLYSFIRNSVIHGLFSFRDGIHFPGLILGTMGNKNEHLKPEYMNDVIAITCLIDSLYTMEMTWGVTNYYRQDIDYDPHINFLQKCLDVANEKKKESTEE